MKNLKLFVTAAIAVVALLSACETDNLVKYPYENEPADTTWGLQDSIPVISPLYFRGKVGNSVEVIQDTIFYNYVDTLDYTGLYRDTLDSIPYGMCGDSAYFYGLKSTFTTNTVDPIFSVEFTTCFQDSMTADAAKAYIIEGAYPYGDGASNTPGVKITWVDANGREWATKSGSGLSDDNRFVVTQIQEIDPPVYSTYLLLNAEFDVTLYRGGESIRIENGECGMIFGKFE